MNENASDSDIDRDSDSDIDRDSDSDIDRDSDSDIEVQRDMTTSWTYLPYLPTYHLPVCFLFLHFLLHSSFFILHYYHSYPFLLVLICSHQ